MATTLLRSLLKPAGVPGNEPPGRSSTVQGSFGMSQSPSFNDFSLHVAQDVEHDLAEHAAHRTASRFQSCGIDVPELQAHEPYRAFEHANRDAEHWTGRAVTGDNAPLKAMSMPLSRLSLQNHVPLSPPVARPARRKEGKIDGMDYYEFCELIRSNSL